MKRCISFPSCYDEISNQEQLKGVVILPQLEGIIHVVARSTRQMPPLHPLREQRGLLISPFMHSWTLGAVERPPHLEVFPSQLPARN